MRIALISPKGPLYRHRGGIFRKSLRYQPLTLTTLAALVPPDLDVEIAVYDEGIQDVPEFRRGAGHSDSPSPRGLQQCVVSPDERK